MTTSRSTRIRDRFRFVRKVKVLLVGAVCLWWAVLTHSRVQVWHDDLSLWQETTRQAPENPRAWVNLGAAQFADDDWIGAAISWSWALTLSQQPGRMESDRVLVPLYVETCRAELDLRAGDVETARVRLWTIRSQHPDFRPAQSLCAALRCVP